MGNESFIRIVVNPDTRKIYARGTDAAGEEFRECRYDFPFDRQPLVIVSKMDDTQDEVDERVRRRRDVLGRVFGMAAGSRNFGRFAWTFRDGFVMPSDAILQEVSDPLGATVCFLAYRNWQGALTGSCFMAGYLTDGLLEPDRGYRMGSADIKPRVLLRCDSLSEVLMTMDNVLGLLGRPHVSFQGSGGA